MLALGGTFVLGVLVGGLLVGTLAYQRVETLASMRTQSGFADRLTEVIEPTGPEQRRTLRPLLETTGREVETIYRQQRDSLRAALFRMGRQLRPHLTIEQRDRLRAFFQRLRARARRARSDSATRRVPPTTDSSAVRESPQPQRRPPRAFFGGGWNEATGSLVQ